jgi:urease accessory protein
MRAHAVLPAGTWDEVLQVDQVLLDFDQRFRRRIVLTTVAGGTLTLDLPHAVRLRDGDGLVADDNSVIRVCARPEPLLDIAAAPSLLARIAWHLGNRHLPVQFAEGTLRIRADHVIAAMVEGLGASIRPLEVPFDPEPGAYVAAGAHHHHGDEDEHVH